jgi:heterotetrameric sarcosine oxidase gamma subunit
MDNSPHTHKNIDIDGVSVGIEPAHQIASLRYFDASGRFAAAVREALGQPLAEPLRAVQVEDSAGRVQFILAWRSPSENLLLCSDQTAFSVVATQLAAAVDGCMVDQTGGISVVRVDGPRARNLLLRLGAATALPDLGGARTGRLAELPVLTLCVRPSEYLLLVERVYAHHLLEWIHATAADI